MALLAAIIEASLCYPCTNLFFHDQLSDVYRMTLAGNIIMHGFNDKRKHSIDIRISYVNEEIVICLKDDGIPFNPEEASHMFDEEVQGQQGDEPAFHNIGLHLVSRISKSMTYQNTFGLNILTIVV